MIKYYNCPNYVQNVNSIEHILQQSKIIISTNDNYNKSIYLKLYGV